MLAEAGAEVIRIDRPGGEELRRGPPQIEGESVLDALLNRGKTRVELDLKSHEGRARVASLIARCDVLVEQFRPGVMDRLGFGYEAAKAINPRVIYCAITGYGQRGPRRFEAGQTSITSPRPGCSRSLPVPPIVRRCRRRRSPTSPAAQCRPSSTSCWRCAGATPPGGGFHRHCHDRRDVHLRVARACGGRCRKRFPAPGEARLTGGSARYRLYPTRDGKLVACAALEDKFWRAFCAVIGLAGPLVDDAKIPRRRCKRLRPRLCNAPHPNGARSSPLPIAAPPSWRPSKKPSPIRISSPAACSPGRSSSGRRHNPAGTGPYRSIRAFAPRPAPSRRCGRARMTGWVRFGAASGP